MDDLSSFEHYCIVCDRLIVRPSSAATPEQSTSSQKKIAKGAIRIRNPDGSTTTRTANGVTTTQPPPAPGRSSAQRLAATTGKPLPSKPSRSSTSSSGSEASSTPAPPPFVSDIYCSRKCADKDAGLSTAAAEDMARAFGMEPLNDAVSAVGLMGIGGLRAVASPVSPPSPILGSDTTGSSTASGSVAAALMGQRNGSVSDTYPASSAPKTIEYFRMGRDSPDDMRRQLDKHRRSSANSTSRPNALDATVTQITRQRSGGTHSTSGASSDSLSSLWTGIEDVSVNKSASTSGFVRAMTPMNPPNGERPRDIHRSMSSSSDVSGGNSTAGPQVIRPLPRSALSQTSLGTLPSPGLGAFPPEVGSAPSQTAYLMHSYASAFPSSGLLSPSLRGSYSGLMSPSESSNGTHRASVSSVSSRQSVSGARSNSLSAASWDAFGQAEINERNRRKDSQLDLTALSTSIPTSGRMTPASPEAIRGRSGSLRDDTPKQSLEVDGAGWKICYVAAEQLAARERRRQSSRSRSGSRRRGSASPTEAPVSESGAATRALALPIPTRAGATPLASVLSASNRTARARTPSGPPGAAVRSSSVTRQSTTYTAADLAALRFGATGCAASTFVSHEVATSPPAARSAPRAGFDWEAKGGVRTYELPKGVVVNPNKGLFYFN